MVVPKKRGSAGTLTSGGTSGPGASAHLKFLGSMSKDSSSSRGKGTKPLPDPVTLPEILTKVLVHGCKQVLFIDLRYRLLMYAVLLFFVSLITDYMPLGPSFFSNSQNFLNQYFVKLSWGWTSSLVALFIYLTSQVYCCGNRRLIFGHFGRLLVATLVWFVWTSMFVYIEEGTSQCLLSPAAKTPVTLYSKARRACLKNGGRWTSFDISGHAFLLIWCSLLIIEEARVICGWDNIADMIRNEEYKRGASNTELSDTPLSALNPEDLKSVKTSFHQYNVPVKIVFVLLTTLCLIWDIMLVATAVYFHVMWEKLIGGAMAALTWFVLYRGLYRMNFGISPGSPGIGSFKYLPPSIEYSKPFSLGISTAKGPVLSSSGGGVSRSRSNKPKEPDDTPSFMGMPLDPLKAGKKLEGIGFDACSRGDTGNN